MARRHTDCSGQWDCGCGRLTKHGIFQQAAWLMSEASSSIDPLAAMGSSTPTVRASILIVEDDPIQRATVEAALAPLGHRIVSAMTASAALRCLLENCPFAVIILDVRLPGTDGFELATLIRSRETSRDTPLIFL